MAGPAAGVVTAAVGGGAMVTSASTADCDWVRLLIGTAAEGGREGGKEKRQGVSKHPLTDTL